MKLPYFSGLTTLAALLTGLHLSPAQATIAGRFTVSGQEVTDVVTGLVWRLCAEGQTFTGTTCEGEPALFLWEEALMQAQSEADATGLAWRLPNVKEMASLVDPALAMPAMDTLYFPGAPAQVFWTSTPKANSATGSWAINMAKGGVSPLSHQLYFAARLVRKGRP